MTEPTLGQRIILATTALANCQTSRQRNKLTAGLEALAARADAAERLAEAADELEAAYSGHGVNRSVDDHQAALGVFHEALAAWREVGE